MAVNEDLLKQVLEQIRPNLQGDGGDMEYVGVDEDGVVSLELQGACAGCPMSQLTLSMGIERVLKEHVPGVTRVVAVNDNAAGTRQFNPAQLSHAGNRFVRSRFNMAGNVCSQNSIKALTRWPFRSGRSRSIGTASRMLWVLSLRVS